VRDGRHDDDELCGNSFRYDCNCSAWLDFSGITEEKIGQPATAFAKGCF
jgi:hypothetical protein